MKWIKVDADYETDVSDDVKNVIENSSTPFNDNSIVISSIDYVSIKDYVKKSMVIFIAKYSSYYKPVSNYTTFGRPDFASIPVSFNVMHISRDWLRVIYNAETFEYTIEVINGKLCGFIELADRQRYDMNSPRIIRTSDILKQYFKLLFPTHEFAKEHGTRSCEKNNISEQTYVEYSCVIINDDEKRRIESTIKNFENLDEELKRRAIGHVRSSGVGSSSNAVDSVQSVPNNQVTGGTSSIDGESQNFTCRYCGKVYKSKKWFKRHVSKCKKRPIRTRQGWALKTGKGKQ